jgi:hypothetical protein
MKTISRIIRSRYACLVGVSSMAFLSVSKSSVVLARSPISSAVGVIDQPGTLFREIVSCYVANFLGTSKRSHRPHRPTWHACLNCHHLRVHCRHSLPISSCPSISRRRTWNRSLGGAFLGPTRSDRTSAAPCATVLRLHMPRVLRHQLVNSAGQKFLINSPNRIRRQAINAAIGQYQAHELVLSFRTPGIAPWLIR